MERIEQLAQLYMSKQEELKKLEEEIAHIKQEITSLVPLNQMVTTEGDLYIFNESYEAYRFHPTLLRKDLPDIYEQYNIKKTYTRLIVGKTQ